MLRISPLLAEIANVLDTKMIVKHKTIDITIFDFDFNFFHCFFSPNQILF